MSKCDKCEKLIALQTKYERLEVKYNRLLGGEQVRKLHFDLDGDQTACGISLFDHDVDTTENIKSVTCGNCKHKWQMLKAKWEKELQRSKKQC